MRFIILFSVFILLLIGGFFGLWKFDKWLRPLTTSEVVFKNNDRKSMIYIIRNRTIILFLVFIWIFTLVSGMFGVWKNTTAPLLISTSAFLTIGCVISMVKKCHCNICLGICYIYWGYLCLLAIYKIGYWQFAISYWWLIGTVAFNTVISLLALWGFVKNDKQIPKSSKKKVVSFSALGIAVVTYPIIRTFGRFLKQSNVGNDVAVPILMICLFLFSLTAPFGARYLVLDDSKMLRQFEFQDDK